MIIKIKRNPEREFLFSLIFFITISHKTDANDLIPPEIAGLDLQEITYSSAPLTSKKAIELSLDLPFYTAFGTKDHPEPLRTCTEVINLQNSVKHYLEPSKEWETPTLTDITSTCIAAKLNLNAEPSKTTFISKNPIDESMLKSAPYALGLNSSYYEKQHFLHDHPKAKWADSGPILRLKKHDIYNVTLILNGARQHIKLVGRGDINGDGIEDIILKITNTMDPPSNYFTSSLWVLTRLQPKGDYIVLESYDGFGGEP
ncbi:MULTISPECIES: hypothetical protein [Pseudomonas]|uniref:Uncharacterized protein n=1 Tax=Pseudomonas quercus TaxID=2722792 RepID=A0ABX0YFL1_9PSED|nr:MULTISPECIES: hypothetical protein [Pseudomonas]MBF7143538.1 hypothetical protein [Pseudomonas sp. LY10J]NJP02204.1 hypothetical protein [Pseudomonas quercus]